MQFDQECAVCLKRRQLEIVGGNLTDPKVQAYMADIEEVLRTAPPGVSAPYCIPGFAAALKKHYGIIDSYAQIKEDANRYALSILPRIRQIAGSAVDPIQMALKFSRTGNYLDFAVLSAEIISAELADAVEHTPEQDLDAVEYGNFRRELAEAKSMLLLADNAGEIVFDMVLVEQIKKAHPQLELFYVVRGGNAQNDATRKDAADVGMDKLVPILDNGSCIPATELDYCGRELLDAIQSADLILAKGQANFESLLGCGLNVYYAFLCKCKRLSRILGMPLMQGMFLCEHRLPELHP